MCLIEISISLDGSFPAFGTPRPEDNPLLTLSWMTQNKTGMPGRTLLIFALLGRSFTFFCVCVVVCKYVPSLAAFSSLGNGGRQPFISVPGSPAWAWLRCQGLPMPLLPSPPPKLCRRDSLSAGTELPHWQCKEDTLGGSCLRQGEHL